jgi:flagellum-specific peptidoglycan hydrolase FlgJ
MEKTIVINILKILKSIGKYVILGGFFAIISYSVHTFSVVKEKQHFEKNYEYRVHREKLELDYYGALNVLVDTIDSYIKEIAPSSTMEAIEFVKMCDKYNMDLFFVIAQAQVESTFATKGLGKKMNSAFNVKAYDGKGSKHMDKYQNPNESIEPYMLLVKKNYMGDSKTEMDLMNKYIDLSGKRYASNPDYETMLLSTYNKLKGRYENLYNEYLRFKILTNK